MSGSGIFSSIYKDYNRHNCEQREAMSENNLSRGPDQVVGH